MPIKQYHNISSIIDNYDAFIIDLWGVIHDGRLAYPGVGECLKKMKDAGKTIIFLSNAPRRSTRAVEGLQAVGIAEDLYDHVVTSGEVTYEYIKKGGHELGKKYYMISPERDAGLLDGAGYERSASPAGADFAVVTGFDEDNATLEGKKPELEECLQNNLPMICANPDMVVVRQTGVRALCAGVIAEKYEQMGGKTQQFGKPHREVYEKALSFIGECSKSRIAAIGDNLDTDIKGANNIGLDSYLIAGGILGEELGITHGQMPPADALEALCNNHGISPTSVLPAFVWE